jgi:hypothetical protein
MIFTLIDRISPTNMQMFLGDNEEEDKDKMKIMEKRPYSVDDN